ncbi:MAG TPA: hypothetical protein VEM15_02370 [Thermodesulfobacteriota bacterium]|nr:hypothetical protein [Thermodesulfobacteriota bacterium]
MRRKIVTTFFWTYKAVRVNRKHFLNPKKGENKMKWLVALLLVLCLVTPAMAGEDLYIGVVGNDINAKPFYLSPKYQQFLYDQTILQIPTSGENFYAQYPVLAPEVCDTLGIGTPDPAHPGEFIPPWTTRGNLNALIPANDSGWYQWYIRLPKKPSGEFNIVFQCGVLKPNGFAFEQFSAVDLCAAHTGELTGPQCSRQALIPGVDPINPGALPSVVAIALPGPYNSFTPFYLTAYRTPGTYTINFSGSGAIGNDAVTQELDGSANARIMLKSCMDENVVVKLPIPGQQNAGTPKVPITPQGISVGTLTNVESMLVEGDVIFVELNFPYTNTTDVYCHAQSVRVMGVGESWF